MGSSGLSFGVPATNDPQASYKLQMAAALARIKPSASWFDWIAILSVVNGAIALGNGNWNFLLGLGVTTVLNAYARAGQISPTLSLAVTVVVAAFFWLMGRFAKSGQKWALILGMALYALDGILIVPYELWLMIAFHVYALIMLARAFGAISALEAVKADAQAHGVFVDQ